MYDWILEADIARYLRALDETRDHIAREKLNRLIAQARSRLFESTIAARRKTLEQAS